MPGSLSLSEIAPFSHGCGRSSLKMDTVGSQPRNSSASHPSLIHIAPEDLPEMVKEDFQAETPEARRSPVEYQDKLYLHLKENLGKVKAYASEIARKIPVPDQCTIEGECSELPKPQKGQKSLESRQKPPITQTARAFHGSSAKLIILKSPFIVLIIFFHLVDSHLNLRRRPFWHIFVIHCVWLPVPSVEKNPVKESVA